MVEPLDPLGENFEAAAGLEATVLAFLGEVEVWVRHGVEIIVISPGTVEVSLICLLKKCKMEWCPVYYHWVGMVLVLVSPSLGRVVVSRVWKERSGNDPLMGKASPGLP